MRWFILFAAVPLFLLVGCGFLENAKQAAQTPQPLFDGKTPIKVMWEAGQDAAKGNYIDAIVQATLAVATIVAGAIGLSAKKQAKRTAKRLNGAPAGAKG